MLKEDLERNVTLCLHNSFCRNRESKLDPLPCCKQWVEEQKCWRTASNSVRIANDVLQDTETYKCRVSITGGRDGTLTNGRKNKMQKEGKLEEFRGFRTSKRRNEKKTKKRGKRRS